MISIKSSSLVIALFTLMVLALPVGGILQTPTPALAQVDIDADTLIQETRDDVEQEIEQEAEQEAEQEQEQEQENEQSAEQDNAADVSQDEENNQVNVGAGDGNVLENENEFGDDDAVVDQDNEADQDAANVGIQDQDLTQTIDQVQDAANLNVDFDVQVAQQIEQQPEPTQPTPTQPPGTPGEPGTPGQPPEEEPVFCYTWNDLDVPAGEPPRQQTSCFSTLQECQEDREEKGQSADVVLTSECQRFDEPPPGAIIVGDGRRPRQ